MQYKVLRPFDGDRAYQPGDTFEANPVDVIHLLGTSLEPLELERGVAVPLGTDAKGEVTDAPVTDAPVTDAPVTDAPVTDAPVTDAPVTDAPVTDAPVTDAPARKGRK